jgi:hypothetical protein
VRDWLTSGFFGIVGAALAIWLVPSGLLPWLTGVGVILWSLYCVVGSGFPLLPTAAWALPVAAAAAAPAYLAAPWATVVLGLGLLGLVTMAFYGPARSWWYRALFHVG